MSAAVPAEQIIQAPVNHNRTPTRNYYGQRWYFEEQKLSNTHTFSYERGSVGTRNSPSHNRTMTNKIHKASKLSQLDFWTKVIITHDMLLSKKSTFSFNFPAPVTSYYYRLVQTETSTLCLSTKSTNKNSISCFILPLND